MPAMPMPPTAVLDTNVLLDLLWFRDARALPLAHALDQGMLMALSCPAARGELVHQLHSSRLAAWAGPPGADAAARAALVRHDGWVRAHPDPSALATGHARLRCTDPDDQVFIDLALTCSATWLLSHDRALLKLARRARPLGLRIATPWQWQAEAGTVTRQATGQLTGQEKGRPGPPW